MLKQLMELEKKELLSIVLVFILILILNLPVLFYVRNMSYQNSKQELRLDLEQVFKELQNKIFYRVKDSLAVLSENNQLVTLLANMNSNSHVSDVQKKNVGFLLTNTKQILNANTVYLMDKTGEVVAGTNYGTNKQSFVGENYSFRPYFQNALAGTSTVYGAVGKTSGQRGIYFSNPVRDNNHIIGVVVVKVGLKEIDDILKQFDYLTMILSPQKIVFSTNDEQYMYKALSQNKSFDLPANKLKEQFGTKSIGLLETEIEGDKAKFNGKEYLFESFNFNIQGWQITSFRVAESFFYNTKGKKLFIFILLTTLLLGIVILALIVNRFHKIRLEKRLRKFSKAIEQSPISVVITDLEGTIEYVNQAFEKITGYQREEVIGKNPSILKSGEHEPEHYKDLWETILSGNTWEGEFYNQKKNGDYYWEQEKITPLINKAGELDSFIGIKEDITEEKELKKELKFFAKMDKLTQVYNRRAGYKILKEIKKEADGKNESFTIAFIDINNLKEVNDVYGHETGDQLIVNIVEIFKKTTRNSDCIFRLGGDEFLIVFKYSKSKEVRKIMQRVQNKLKKVNQTGNYNYQMSISYGIESYNPNKKIAIDELVSRADNKMYQFKKDYKENHNLPQR